jgi:sortase A
VLASLSVATLLVVEVLVGYLMQQRAQAQLAQRFSRYAAIAASAYGQAGLSPMPDAAALIGEPVAIIDVPALALTQIAIEGSTAQRTRNGLGHVPGTAMPGNSGHAVLVGRRSTFGAPLRDLPAMPVGAVITVTTIQGQSRYKVIDVQPDSLPENVLELRTASAVLASSGTVSVFAQMQGQPFPALPRNNAQADAAPSSAQAILVLQLVMLLGFAVVRLGSRLARPISWLLLGIPLLGALVALALVVDGLLPATL